MRRCSATASASSPALRRRLAPLFAAVFLQRVVLWVPIEELFLPGIGFDDASVEVMAAVYAVAVPLLEMPSGVLADRCSRRGALLLATLAAIVSVTVGGLSRNVPTYLVSAVFLGVFFAMQSGTFDSVVYDTVLGRPGTARRSSAPSAGSAWWRASPWFGSALVGAGIAELAPLPATYFATIIPLVGAGVALLGFQEPSLHKVEEDVPLHVQLATTYRTLLRRGRLRTVVALTVVASLLMRAMLEFGPLWLVAEPTETTEPTPSS